MQMYESDGYSRRDAVRCIIEHNLFGLDIDDRAAQLAYFAVMMKARQYDRKFLSRGVQPHICAIQESNETGGAYKLMMGDFLLSKEHQETLNYLLDAFIDAKEYGSALCLDKRDYHDLLMAWKYTASQTAWDINLTLWHNAVEHTVAELIEQAILLTQEYDVVVTNPPYMGSVNMDAILSKFVKEHYPDTKSDMSTVMMERSLRMCKPNGFMAMINIPVWMFLSSYEKLREHLIAENTIINMVHPGRGIFGSDFGTTSFVIGKTHVPGYMGSYCRLFDKQGDVQSIEEREQAFLSGKGRYTAQQSNFSKIPGSPVAYWASKALLLVFECGKLLCNVAQPKQGMSTCDVDRFTRSWAEVSAPRTNLNDPFNLLHWVRYNKGGNYRKWYGNKEYVVYWGGDGNALIANKALLRNRDSYFKPFIAWTKISSSGTGFRKFEEYYLFDGAGGTLFVNTSLIAEPYLLGLLNSKVCTLVLSLISPTLNFNENHIGSVPVIETDDVKTRKIIEEDVNRAVQISRDDWDSYETSWDFQQHPLVRLRAAGAYAWGDKPPVMRLSSAYNAWKLECEGRFEKLKANEEELNSIFIDIYGLQDELTPDVADRDVTVHRIFDTKDDVPESMQGSSSVCTKRDEIVSLLSYAVGCMFGRYSLDVDGLAYAGGDWDDGKYKTFQPDRDGILPITDAEYLKDDLISHLCGWLKTVYGEDTLEENLNFIAGALGGSGNSSREIIRS